MQKKLLAIVVAAAFATTAFAQLPKELGVTEGVQEPQPVVDGSGKPVTTSSSPLPFDGRGTSSAGDGQ